MKFPSAEEDFVANTLAAIPRSIEKLNFMLDIREENGQFVHWGLERLYGTQHARTALNGAYRTVLTEILKTPIKDLWNEVVVLCRDVEERSDIEYLGNLREAVYAANRNSQADDLHLRFTLDGLLLAATSRRANRNA